MSKTILFNDFKKQYSLFKNGIDSSIREVLESGQFILGEKVRKFEEEFSAYLGSRYCIGVANGLEALQIALMALGIGKGDEVITTSLSAAATALAVKAAGAKPVFADIDDYYGLDPRKIEGKITAKTKAIIPVHLYGQAADIGEIRKIARQNKIFLIEDAAQAHGAEYKGKKLGTFGDLGCFSFYPTKNLGAFGDGGLIATDSKYLFEKCKTIRNYGQKNRYEHKIYGLNSRLDEIQASILLVGLKHLDELNEKRRKNAALYFGALKGVKQLKLPLARKNAKHIYHQFVIEASRRDELMKWLREKGIPALIHYPIPIHKQECFPEFNHIKLPVLEGKIGSIMSLPIHPFLEDGDLLRIAGEIRKFYGY
jgi:dTDP-4-amino-4,6-dideoxygalactose transaminase